MENEIIIYQPDETISLEVRLENETVWLSQLQMAELFHVKVPAVSKHINNLYDEGELERQGTISILETVRKEGNRNVRRKVEYYNLDVIISVGYRIKSQVGTRFRIWATNVLKQYLLKGYAIHAQLQHVEQRLDSQLKLHSNQIAALRQQVDFLVKIHDRPTDRIFPTGCVFDAWEYVSTLIRSARQRIILIDNYCDERTLAILSKRAPDVICTIYTRYNETFQADLDKHNRQYPIIEKVQLSHKEHDRFLIIDDSVYILGDSLKDIGHSMTTVLKTSFSPDMILSQVQ